MICTRSWCCFVGDGAERNPKFKFESAANEEEEDIVDIVRCRSCLLDVMDGGMVVDCTDDTDVRRSCLDAWEEDDDVCGDAADMVWMLVGESARVLAGLVTVDISACAASLDTVRGASDDGLHSAVAP